MKKITLLLIPIIGILLFSGCAGPKAGGSTESSDMSDMPDWCEASGMKRDGYYYACAFAKKKNPSLSRSIASTRSRAELATAVETDVRQLIQDFLEESGVDDESEVSEYAVAVAQTVTSSITSMSTIDNQKFGEDGVYYVLIKLDMNQVSKETANAVKKNKALYDKLQAMGKINEMNQIIMDQNK